MEQSSDILQQYFAVNVQKINKLQLDWAKNALTVFSLFPECLKVKWCHYGATKVFLLSYFDYIQKLIISNTLIAGSLVSHFMPLQFVPFKDNIFKSSF